MSEEIVNVVTPIHSLSLQKHVVEQKEKERQDVSFSRQCIYCSETLTGGVTNCFHHLTHQHSFSLGNPDNIVYGANLLDILHEKLRKYVRIHFAFLVNKCMKNV